MVLTTKKRKVLTKKEKEACRYATEQVDAISDGGVRPFALRPRALNLVVSKIPEVIGPNDVPPPTCLHIKAVLLTSQHLYAYYSSGYSGHYHIGRLDTLTGTWESSTMTLNTAQPGSKVIAFNFSQGNDPATAEGYEQHENDSLHQNPQQPKRLDHLKGFLVFTARHGVIVRTLGDFDQEERVIEHTQLLATMQPPPEEQPQPANFNDLVAGIPQAELIQAARAVMRIAPPAEDPEAARNLLIARIEMQQRLAELHAQMALMAVTISWLAIAVDAAGRAVYAQAEVSFGQERLLSQLSFFRLDMSGSEEALARPWRRLDVPGVEALPQASAMFVYEGALYLLERVFEGPADHRGDKFFGVSHVYRIDLLTLEWQLQSIRLDASQVAAGTGKPLANLTSLEFTQLGSLVYCIGTERIPEVKEEDEEENRNAKKKKKGKSPSQKQKQHLLTPHQLRQQLLQQQRQQQLNSAEVKRQHATLMKQSLVYNDLFATEVGNAVTSSFASSSSSKSTSTSPTAPLPPLPPLYRNELWTLELATGRLSRCQSSSDHLIGQAALKKPMLAVVDAGEEAPLKELWALETAEPLPSNVISCTLPSAGPGLGIIPEQSLPLYRIPLKAGSLRELARDAFFARPPRGLLAMVACEESLRRQAKAIKLEVKDEDEEEKVVVLQQDEEVQFMGIMQHPLPPSLVPTQATASTSSRESTALKRKSTRLMNAAVKRKKVEEKVQQFEMAPVQQANRALVKRFLREEAQYPETVFGFPPNSEDRRFKQYPKN